MKKYLALAACAGMAACQTEDPGTTDEYILSKEVFTTSVGKNKVYGVQFRATSENEMTKGFSIQFSQNEKVWMDSVYMDMMPGDTLESELIFSDAVADENDNTGLYIESFEVE